MLLVGVGCTVAILSTVFFVICILQMLISDTNGDTIVQLGWS